MKYQTTVSHPIHIGRGYLDQKRFTRVLIVATSLIMVLIMSACGTALPVPENQPDEPSAAGQINLIEEGANVQRAFDADAARYNGLANLYSSESEANSHQAMEAETARYSGLAVRYSTENEIGQPLPFDVEHLRQIYDANWGIEADAADVHRTVQPIKGNAANEPPAFNIEHLRQIYDANWSVEADRVDVNPTGQPSAFMATNPELALAQRYSSMVEWQRLHHPGR